MTAISIDISKLLRHSKEFVTLKVIAFWKDTFH